MKGRLKSRLPEKCTNCIWGRFPSQFWHHFESMLGPKMHFFAKKELLEISPKKGYPPSLKQPRERTTAKPDGSPKAPPRARAFSNKKQLIEQLLAIVLDLLQKKRSRCNKSEMVAENSKIRSTWWGCYQRLFKTCWKRCSDYWNKCSYSESMKLLEKWPQVLERRHSVDDLTRPGQRPGELHP